MPDGTTATTDATLGKGDEGTPKTYVESEVTKMVVDARTSVMADANRIQAEAQKALKAAQDADARVTRMLKDYEEDIRDDPDKLSAFRARQAKQQADDELARVTQELKEANEKWNAVETEKKQSSIAQATQDIAARIGVDAAKLLKLAKFTDGTTEAIEDIAKDLPKINPPKTPSSFDSNRARGGNQSDEQIRAAYIANPNDPVTRTNYLVWRRGKGI